ncbi:MAG: RadC family protein [Pseudomonadales bacterium]
MAISDWPSDERPREKLLQRGASALSDAELLAIFLRTGTRGVSALQLARSLLAHCGNLRTLCELSQRQFCTLRGLGPCTYAQLQAMLELNRRYLLQAVVRENVMDNPEAVKRYLVSQLRHRQREVFACLFLDTKHAVLAFEVLFKGTLNAASVYPREVVKMALLYNAGAVILCHNHPSGVAEPSQADRTITKRLSSALALVDITVLDHIIVGERAPVSFAQRGLL